MNINTLLAASAINIFVICREKVSSEMKEEVGAMKVGVAVRSALTFLEFQQQNANSEENSNPDACGDEAEVDLRVVDGPAAL
jgi:hypothetical protein